MVLVFLTYIKKEYVQADFFSRIRHQESDMTEAEIEHRITTTVEIVESDVTYSQERNDKRSKDKLRRFHMSIHWS